MTGFRSWYLSDWKMRVIDAFAHLTFALILPGPVYLTWLPDIAIPALFIASMVSNRFLPGDFWLLRVHRFLHFRKRIGIGISTLILCSLLSWHFINATFGYGLLLHYLAHILVDELTHDKLK